MKKIYTLLFGLILISSSANSQTIFAIQTPGATADTSAFFGQTVNTNGIVTAVRSNGYYIQDGTGSWNGIFVFDSGNTPAMGDDISITAVVDEFFNMTELKTVTSFVINSTGNTLPAATNLSTLAVNDEQYEGVLVKVSNAQSMGAPNGFGEWDVNDGTGVATIDDGIFPFIPVVSNFYDVTGVIDYAFGVYKIEPRNAADIVGAAGGPNYVSIFNIQNTVIPNGDSPELGNIVTTKGVVTGVVTFGAPGTFFIQDGNGAWNGIYVFESGTPVARGDSVEVTGTVDEFNNTTELVSVTNITILNAGNTLPSPSVITTGNANMEEWEGVLIRVVNSQCTSNSVGFGMWELNDGSGIILADDDIFPYALSAVVSTNYNVTGIGHYSFSAFKILPRDANDISISTGIEEISNNNINVYPNPASEFITFDLSVASSTIQLFDITGKTLRTINSNKNKFSVSLNLLTNGIYFYSISDVKGNVLATNKFVVAK